MIIKIMISTQSPQRSINSLDLPWRNNKKICIFKKYQCPLLLGPSTIWGTAQWKNLSFSWSAKKIIPNRSLKEAVGDTITLASPSLVNFLFRVTACSTTQTHTLSTVSDAPKNLSSLVHKLTRHPLKDGEAALQAPSLYINSYFTYSYCKIQRHAMLSAELLATSLRSKGEIRSPSTGPSHLLLGGKTIRYFSRFHHWRNDEKFTFPWSTDSTAQSLSSTRNTLWHSQYIITSDARKQR